jgi:chemotaxis signal transduction protein/SRSO17 transposase
LTGNDSGALSQRWREPGQHGEVKQVAHDEYVPADFVSMFQQRFAPLFGRKIGRQRAEQYLGGLLSGRAERRNVTSLAGTVDGASARALGWLLNKSPWPTRPLVSALQRYIGDTYGTPDGLFTLNLDCFVKRGDNAVGVDKQFVPHVGRTLNCQIGVFLAYGSAHGSSLVDAAIYMPHAWIDDAARRTRAGVPDGLTYQSRSALALDLLRNARAEGHLPGTWVTSWHGEGFEPDLRARLAAEGWLYLLPIPASTDLYDGPDVAEPSAAAALFDDLAGAADDAVLLRRVWEPADDGTRHACWLVVCTNAHSGGPIAFLSNAPDDAAATVIRRVLAARGATVRMLAERCAGVSLDVYRVRGWDGWHRHVALALLASGFRACLPSFAADRAALTGGTPPLPYADDRDVDETPIRLAPADAAVSLEDALLPHHDETTHEGVEFSLPLDAAVFEAEPRAAQPTERVTTTFRVTVTFDETDWRAVRAFQTWLVGDEAGTILYSSPTRAEIERQEVGDRMEMRFESEKTLDEVLSALDEVPEIVIAELVAEAPAALANIAGLAEALAEDDTEDELEDTDDLLAALHAELIARTEAREAGAMPAFAGPAEVIGNAVADVTRTLESSRGLVAAQGSSGTNRHEAAPANASAQAGGSATLDHLATPVAPLAEAPGRRAAGSPSTAPASTSALAETPAAAPAAAPATAGKLDIAGKRQAAERTHPAEEQVVVLDVGDESYGIPVQRVREIIRVPPITRVPNGPAFLEGVINLRGQVIPVMDLRKHLGMTTSDQTRRSRVVVSELGQHTVGLMVDGVSQVVMVAATDIEPPPAIIAGANNGQVCGVARLGDRLVLFLDPDRVLPAR